MTAEDAGDADRAHAPSEMPADSLTIERLRTIVQDSHVSFLIGAGTPSAYFAPLGNVELVLAALASSALNQDDESLIRASIHGYFFEHVLLPNLDVISREEAASEVIGSYARFLRTINRLLLKRHSSILTKQVNVFTTNVDMVFEVALEQLGIDYSDGFSGKIKPRFDLSDFNTLRFRMGSRYEHRSEVPVFNLIKLHGSAGWVQEQRADRDRSDIYFDHGLSQLERIREAHALARDDFLEVLVEPAAAGAPPAIRELTSLAAAAKQRSRSPEAKARVGAFARAYAKLGIVNPDKGKFETTVLNETYYELIRRFANELEKESSVLFVHGFSFRDEHLRDLVLRAARTNPTLQIVIFCYSEGDRSVYEELLPESEVKNGNVMCVVPRPQADGTAGECISLDNLDRDYFAEILDSSVAPSGEVRQPGSPTSETATRV